MIHFLIYSLLFLIGLLLLVVSSRRNPKAPPGPRPWPVFGNLIQLGLASTNPMLAISHFSKHYGPLVSLKVGMKNIVVISSKPMLDSISLIPETSGRDRSGILHDRTFGGKPLGLTLNVGKLAQDTRAWTFKTLRALGFGKSNAVEHFIGEAAENVFKRIDDVDGVMDMESLLGPILMSVAYQITTCQPLSPQDAQYIEIIYEKNSEFINSAVFGLGFGNAFPFMRYLFPVFTGSTAEKSCSKANNDISKKLLHDAIERSRNNATTDDPTFADLFAQKMIEEGGRNDSIFFEENFQLLMSDILFASSDTTSALLQGIILHLILQPKVQKNLYKEIYNTGEFIQFSDMKRMPYTQAIIYEALRVINIAPNLMPRQAIKDFMFEGYLIEKNSIILPDIHTCNNDERFWNNPSEFNPMRFIGTEGQFLTNSNFIPFGTGPRKCPGELHGMMATFIFLTRIVQRYELKVPEGDPTPRSDMCPGMVSKPFPFRVKFTRR